jgi:hypothetical protein
VTTFTPYLLAPRTVDAVEPRSTDSYHLIRFGTWDAAVQFMTDLRRSVRRLRLMSVEPRPVIYLSTSPSNGYLPYQDVWISEGAAQIARRAHRSVVPILTLSRGELPTELRLVVGLACDRLGR